MATVLEEFVNQIKWDTDQASIEKLNSTTDKTLKIFGALTAAVSGAIAAFSAFAVSQAKQVSIQTNLARSLGVTAEFLETFGFLTGAIGLETTRLNMSLRRLNQTMGRLKTGVKAPEEVEKAFKALGISIKDVQNLNTEEQFTIIADAAINMADEQAAAAATTALLGREAVTLTGFLRDQNMTFTEMLENQRQMNLQTEEGRKGAVRLTAAMDNLGAAIESTQGLAAGLFGEALAPVVEGINDWIRANRELIQTKVNEFVDFMRRAIEFALPKIEAFIKGIKDAIDAVGGLEAVVTSFFTIFAGAAALRLTTFFVGLISTIKTLTAAQVLHNIAAAGMAAAYALLPVVIGLILEDLYRFLTGGESVIGDFVDLIKRMYATWVTTSEGVIRELIISTAELFGASEKEAQEWLIEIDNSIRGLTRSMGAFLDETWGKWNKIVQDVIDLVKRIPFASKFSFKELTSGSLKLDPKLASQDSLNPQLPSASTQNAMTNNSNQSRVDQRNEFNFDITQLPGEDSEAFGQKIGDMFEEKMSKVVRDMDTGVDY